MKGSLNRKVFLLISFISILIGMLGYYFLPEKFFYDSINIVNDPLNEIGWFGGSYPFTISIYHYSGLAFLPNFLIGFIQLSIVFIILNKLGIPKDFGKVSYKNLFLYFSFLFAGVFLGQPTKEFIAFIIMLVLLKLILDNRYTLFSKSMMCVFILFLFGILFRPYYLLIPFIVFGMYIVVYLPIRNKLFWVIVAGIFVVFSISIAVYFLKGDFLTELYREQINDPRVGEDFASSMISSPVRPTTWYNEFVSIIYGFFAVNIPVDAIRLLLKPQVLVFICWQIVFVIIFYKKFRLHILNRFTHQKEILVYLFVLAMFIIQGCFEPDYGSVLRHRIGFFPFIYFIIIDGVNKKE
ncbi:MULTISPECIES: hypothetical protein [Myroides]|uniref:Glycosyltransferase RgtA/B/C/D-like domain-containing protein n=1 Tax=Myroides albus TaxID=2562892 RepID=A0A6I3LHF1_9FLAO|nr:MULTISPECIES: hypothetical protein [Myroides]MTG96570.1 hypothetical protein [Myroides albus]MVX34566.1 hypothetical protein [Myroides sp. LoEW2-1]UVD81016.1 hypothetical protein NWE55_07150 [Myroides albus]